MTSQISAPLARFEKSLVAGAEWLINHSNWVLLQLNRGAVYVRSQQLSSELFPGATLVIPPNSPVTILASVLGEAALHGTSINFRSLSGVVTAAERICFEQEAREHCWPFAQLPASHSLSARMADLSRGVAPIALPVRLGLVLAFAEWFSPVLASPLAEGRGEPRLHPREKLKRFLNEAPESELMNLSLGDVARHLGCSERHASRIFHEACGSSFRNFISEVRLNKACQLLLHADFKIIDVALESGHSSLALFNYSFKNRFRMTPTKWRQRHALGGRRDARQNGPNFRLVAVPA